MNRLSAEPKQRRSLPVIDQRVAAMTDFNPLPGMSEISVQRAFGTVVGISNPDGRGAGHRAIRHFLLGQPPSRGRASAAPRARGGARQQTCVVFVSGHATNVSSIGALLGPKDLIVHDSLAHNSIVIGGTLSRAERHLFPHNDLDELDELLTSTRHHTSAS
jgi:8-amino-7-oxononanoate synthase